MNFPQPPTLQKVSASTVTLSQNELNATQRQRGFGLAVTAQIAMAIGASAPSAFYPVLAQTIGFGPTVITLVFAVYAATLLATLLTAGAISDHLGRKPVVAIGFALLAVSMLIFCTTETATLLLFARALQGVASGLLLAALSAVALDFTETSRQARAGLWNALSPGIGLALGALISGLALNFLPHALPWVFVPLILIYLGLAALFMLIPETSPRRAGALASLKLRITIPPSIRGEFWRGTPAIVAGWATGGLFLSLGASLIRNSFGNSPHIWQALVVTVLAGSGVVASFLLRKQSPRVISLFGSGALALGTGASLLALSVHSLPFYLLAAALTGTGFGTAFSGVVASLIPQIPATERADTFAALFLFSYLSIGVPAVVAGLFIGLVGFELVWDGYGVLVIALALTALLLKAFSSKQTAVAHS